MKKFFIDVFDPSGKILQKLEIFPSSVRTSDGTVFNGWVVVTFTGTGSFNSLLNGANLIAMNSGKPYGSFLGFNFNLAKGASFSVQYQTGTYSAVINDVKDLPDPKPDAPVNNNGKNYQQFPVNDPNFDMNQKAIDYVNETNQ
jgi:hypothetical protein